MVSKAAVELREGMSVISLAADVNKPREVSYFQVQHWLSMSPVVLEYVYVTRSLLHRMR